MTFEEIAAALGAEGVDWVIDRLRRAMLHLLDIRAHLAKGRG
jgi:hypothetical protein